LSNIHETLKKYWGYDSFRPGQQDIVQAAMRGEDCLALLPTGGGKSICFQVPVLSMEGLGLVISPLIALMEDQVQNLNDRNIPAAAIRSGMTDAAIETIISRSIHGKIKFLYVAPERLNSKPFLQALERLPVCLLAIDEAHCISQWGYDFRPAYLNIAAIRPYLKNIPIIALTATATPDVVNDIQEKLLFRKKQVFHNSFARKNLAYSVLNCGDKRNEILQLFRFYNGTAIIYARNRRGTKEIADWLNQEGISADFYHAGLQADIRSQKQKNWIDDHIRVMVATNAFGMGIDKPNVRLVIHTEPPDSPEAYFQEAGRGGRDGELAASFLLISPGDTNKFLEKINRAFPTPEEIKSIYHHITQSAGISFGEGTGQVININLVQVAKTLKIPVPTLNNGLAILAKEGYWFIPELSKAYSRIHIHQPPATLRNAKLQTTEDSVKQALIRLYSGIFETFVPVSESNIARYCRLPESDVVNAIKTLETGNFLQYHPKPENGVSLTLIAERIPAKSILLSKENYYQRKEIALSKANAMVNFAKAKKGCRAAILLNYFGEPNSPDCKLCDICLEKHAKNPLKRLHELNPPINLADLLLHIPELRKNHYQLLKHWILAGYIAKNKDNLWEYPK
jgi:ATP-dependent DNA helicase RecQ